jgi:ATP phosphoribosyltransferase
MTASPIKIALAKGRILSEAVALLERLGIRFPEIETSRSLDIPSACGRFLALVIRSSDVPTYVSRGAADLGVVGKDVLWENEDEEENLLELLDLGFSRCRIVAATLGGVVPGSPVWRVATKYPLFTERVFQSHGRPVEVVKLYGSVELAPRAGIADAVVDMVETGSTLKANNLEVIEELGVSTARLIANRVAYKTKNEAMMDLLPRLEEALR